MTEITVPYSKFAPEYSVGTYNLQDSLACALACKLAYFDPDSTAAGKLPGTYFKNWGFDSSEFIEVKRGRDIDTQGYLAKNDQVILAAFRGSEKKFADWATNLQASKDPAPIAGNAHEGFQDAFIASAYEIGFRISQMRDNNQKVWITGHSLGGALAVLLAATILEADSIKTPVDALYTFGSPRVGDKKFANELNKCMQGKSYYRVMNKDDLVPHVPLEMNFEHAGQRILYFKGEDDSLGNRPSDNSSGRKWREYKELMWRWLGRNMRRGSFKVAGPHVLDSEEGYIAHILADIEK